jgi:DNA-binding winged helix-turn-helix (wHTH) protein/Tfp pilus assembly protein PilF
MAAGLIYRFGVFELDAASGDLRRAGVRVRLAWQTAQLLLFLLERRDTLVLRHQLQQHLWPDTHGDHERGLNNAVNRLRDALGETSARVRFIETVPKRGYRFVAPVDVIEAPPPAVVAALPLPEPATLPSPTPAARTARPLRLPPALAALAAALVLAATAAIVLARGDDSEAAVSPARPFYLAAMALRDRPDEGSIGAARKLLDQALDADAAYGPVHAALALNILDSGETGAVPLREARAAARSAAQRALQLDPALADAHHALALVHIREEWRWADAERELQACLRLAPGSASCTQTYADLLAARGRVDEALGWLERASQAAPLSAETHAHAGRLLLFARRYPEAVSRLRRAISLEPGLAPAHKLLSQALWHDGRFVEAQDAYLEWLGVVQVPARELAVVDATLRRGGLPELFQTLLQRRDKPGTRPHGLAFKRATMLAAVGEIGQAVDALEQAAADRDARVIFVTVDPLFEPLAREPRFTALLARLGLRT